MHKNILALAALWGSAAAFAQSSSVTLYGGIDLALAYYRGDGTGSRIQLVPGGNQNNRIGIRGREDLGGGLYAAFELEAGFNADNGTGLPTNTNNQANGTVLATPGTQGLTFNRRSIVSLGGDWGEVRLGRDYVPSFWPIYLYDPFRTGVGFGGVTIQGTTVTNLRASNSIGYFTPACGTPGCLNFFGQAMYAAGENQSSAAANSDGRTMGLRLGYGGEPWEVSIATTKTRAAAVGDFTQSSGGGSYGAKFGRLMALVGVNRTGLPVAVLNNGNRAPFWQVGAMIYAGPGYFPVAYTHVGRNDAQNSSASKIAFGYVYNLSKRTALYTTYAHIENKGALAIPVNVGADAGPTPLPGHPASGIDIGMRHTF
ncbi:porin [Ramlibacter sp. G-1-2-2]|uniref:Porin n=1 Tax=Ramlibacter agri TaxID=2728837 RepID=A0A848H6A2_9BURK|nr:porin [Ramlibacter agri]NML44103.1 porin [Ramlibacter agri]